MTATTNKTNDQINNQTNEKKQISNRMRENVILSSLLFNKDCREYSIQSPIDTSLLSNGETKILINIFNELVKSSLRPSLDMIITQRYPKEEDMKRRNDLIKNLDKLKETCKPVELDLFKEELFFLRKHRFLTNLQNVLKETSTLVQQEFFKPSYHKSNDSINFLQEKLEAIMEDFSPEDVKSLNLSEGLTKQIEIIIDRKNNPEITDTASSGYEALDENLSGGFRKGNFSLICARPGMGKTVVMLNQAVEAAKQGVKTLFISIEMDLTQCLQRVFSKISRVKLRRILQAKLLTNSEMNELKTTAKEASKLYGKNLFLEEVTSITPSQLDSRIKYYQKHFGVELVFVDYIQIMRTNAGKIPKETSDFASISGDLREISKSRGVALVLGAQLSRDVEKRDDKRPMDSDLKNSGDFEQDAAAILHLYRDSVYNPDTEDKNVLEVIIGKNRFGTSNVTLRFTYDYSRQTIYEPAPA